MKGSCPFQRLNRTLKSKAGIDPVKTNVASLEAAGLFQPFQEV